MNESEETEVKNLKWVINELDDEFSKASKVKGRVSDTNIGPWNYWNGIQRGLYLARCLIDQLDEPEVTLDKAFEKVAESYSMTKEEVWRQLEQFEAHAEVLSNEWIDEHKREYDEYPSGAPVLLVDDVKKLLVPKKEKVKVDKEDAENIKHYKEEGWTLSHLINDTDAGANHDELLAQAWLAYPNIEVEKEQKYYVLVEKVLHFAGFEDMNASFVLDDSPGFLNYAKQVTLDEGNKILDKIGSGRLVKVEELEE